MAINITSVEYKSAASSGSGTNFLRVNAGAKFDVTILYNSADVFGAVDFYFQFPDNNLTQYSYQSPFSQEVTTNYTGNLGGVLNAKLPALTKNGDIEHTHLGGGNYQIDITGCELGPFVTGSKSDDWPEVFTAANSPKFVFKIRHRASKANPKIISEALSGEYTNPYETTPSVGSNNVDELGNCGFYGEVFNESPAIWELDSQITTNINATELIFRLKVADGLPDQGGVPFLGIRVYSVPAEIDITKSIQENYNEGYADGLANGSQYNGVYGNIDYFEATKINNRLMEVSVKLSSAFKSAAKGLPIILIAEAGATAVNEIDSERNNVIVYEFDANGTLGQAPNCGVVLGEVPGAGYSGFAFAQSDNLTNYYSDVQASKGDFIVLKAIIDANPLYSITNLECRIIDDSARTVSGLSVTGDVIFESFSFTSSGTLYQNYDLPANDDLAKVSFNYSNGELYYAFAIRLDSGASTVNNAGNFGQDWAQYANVKLSLLVTLQSNSDSNENWVYELQSDKFELYDYLETTNNVTKPAVNSIVYATFDNATNTDLNGGISKDNDTRFEFVFSGTNGQQLGGYTASEMIALVSLQDGQSSVFTRETAFSFKANSVSFSQPVITDIDANSVRITAILTKNAAANINCPVVTSRLGLEAQTPIISAVPSPCCAAIGILQVVNDCNTAPTDCSIITALTPVERIELGAKAIIGPYIDTIDGVLSLTGRYQDACGTFTYTDIVCCNPCSAVVVLTVDNDCVQTPPSPLPPLPPNLTKIQAICGQTVQAVQGGTGIQIIQCNVGSGVGQLEVWHDVYRIPDGIMVRIPGQADVWSGYKSNTFGTAAVATENAQLNMPASFSSASFNEAYFGLYGVNVVAGCSPPGALIPPDDGFGSPAWVNGPTENFFGVAKTSTASVVEVFIFAPIGLTAWQIQIRCM